MARRGTVNPDRYPVTVNPPLGVAEGSPARSWRSRLAVPRREAWVWLVPVVVFAVVWAQTGHLGAIVAALAGVGFVLLVQRRIATAASVLLVVIVFNVILASLALRLGLSVSVVKALSFWKEGVVVGALLAVWRGRPLRRPDGLDIAAAAYVALGTAYLLLPHLFVGNAAGSSLSLYERALDWRNDVFYIGVFVVFRHLRLSGVVLQKILERVLIVVVGVALIGIFQAIFPNAWNDFAVHTLGVPNYEHVVVGYQPSAAFSLTNVNAYTFLHGHSILRVSSVLFDDLAVGFVFAIGLGVAAEMVARRRAGTWVYVSLPVVGTALLLTQTRSAILAGAMATAFALRRRAGKGLAGRARLAKVLCALLIVALPVVVVSGALQRFGAAPKSNAAHQSAFIAGLDVLRSSPLGRGLGTSAGGAQLLVSQQTGGQPTVVLTEDQYLQIGSQLGVLGLILYLVVVALTLRRLLTRARDDPLDLATPAMSNVAVGILLGVVFTQAFVNLELAVLFWGLAGLAVGVVDDRLDAPGASQLDHATMRSPATV